MGLPFSQSSTAFGYRSTSPCEFAQIIWKAFPFLREWTFLLESTGVQNSVSKIRCLLITFDRAITIAIFAMVLLSRAEAIFTLTFHKITPGEGAEARFEQSDSR